jgi:8-oxo-dGTP pyrophosphatase MutT (NUDIX family)
MSQKYKVFIDDSIIFFTSKELVGVPVLPNCNPINDFHELKKRVLGISYQLISNNPKQAMKEFFREFEWIKAAGGMVVNQGSVLWIFRLGKWDFPKGKVEKSEKTKFAALREVQEETGLNGSWKISHKLMESYHVYFAFEKSVIKKTNWYKIHFEGSRKGKPQKSEGITKIAWIEKNNLKFALKNTYPVIKDIVALELR